MGPVVIRAWREFIADAPNEWGGQFVSWAIPATPLFPAEVHNEPAVVPFLVYTGTDLDAAERAVQPLRDLGEPLADKTARLAWTRLQTQYDAAVPAQELELLLQVALHRPVQTTSSSSSSQKHAPSSPPFNRTCS